jgi:hypothetical protein
VRLVIALLVLAAALSHAGVVGAQEQRCQELGASCSCSEQFNTNAFTIQNNTWMNPTDGNTAKNCSELGDGSSTVSPTNWTQHTGASVGLPQLDWVWATRSGVVYGRNITAATVRRAAVRYYFRFSSDFQYGSTGSCGSSKLSQFGWNVNGSSTPEYQWAGLTGPRTPAVRIQGFAGGAGRGVWNAPAQYQKGFSFETCKTRWCRLEMIVAGESVRAGSGLFVEAEVVALGTSPAQRVVTARTSIGSAGARHDTVYSWIANAFRGGSCAGTRYISHAMQAEWSTDADQTIGPAREIEGGGSAPASAPANAPPNPPTNLRLGGVPDGYDAALVGFVITALWTRRRLRVRVMGIR